jgi:hypothetical protein
MAEIIARHGGLAPTKRKKAVRGRRRSGRSGRLAVRCAEAAGSVPEGGVVLGRRPPDNGHTSTRPRPGGGPEAVDLVHVYDEQYGDSLACPG